MDLKILSENINKDHYLTILNTNARSLCPKFDSLLDNLRELSCEIAIITDTWIADGPSLEQDIQDIRDGTGYTLNHLNRQRGARGVAHGGVALVTKDTRISISRFKFHNPRSYEILAVTAKVTGQYRRIFIVACYMPPNMQAEAARECMGLVVDIIHEAKRRLDQPMVVVAGDFNQHDIKRCLSEHIYVKEVIAGPTRGMRAIDKIFVNFPVTDRGVIAPLQANEEGQGSDSDHRVVYASTTIERRRKRTWETFYTRKFTEERSKKFGEWLLTQNWEDVYNTPDVNGKVEAYQSVMRGAMDSFFPLTKVRRASDEPPWMNARLRKEKRRNANLFRSKGRTDTWKELSKKTEELEASCRIAYKETQTG